MANLAEKLGFNPVPIRLGHLKERERKEKSVGECEGCRYCLEIYEFGKSVACNCRLSHMIIAPVGCDMRNKDVGEEKICLNCEHFLGGSDWGLSCAKSYHKLVNALDEACGNFKMIDAQNAQLGK